MLETYTYNTIEDFEKDYENPESLAGYSKVIYNQIKKGISENKSIIDLYLVEILKDNTVYRTSLPKSEWGSALKSCITHLEAIEDFDAVLDVYELSKKLNS